MAKKGEAFPTRIYVTRSEDTDGEVYYSAMAEMPIAENDGEAAAIYELKQTGVLRVERSFEATTQR